MWQVHLPRGRTWGTQELLDPLLKLIRIPAARGADSALPMARRRVPGVSFPGSWKSRGGGVAAPSSPKEAGEGREGRLRPFWQLPLLPPEREFKPGTWARRPTNGRAGRAAGFGSSLSSRKGAAAVREARKGPAPPLGKLQKPQLTCKLPGPATQGFQGGSEVSAPQPAL